LRFVINAVDLSFLKRECESFPQLVLKRYFVLRDPAFRLFKTLCHLFLDDRDKGFLTVFKALLSVGDLVPVLHTQEIEEKISIKFYLSI